jgi:Xaa-Pro aminopeptidase
MFAGYEGGVARTWVTGRAEPTAAQRDLAPRCRAALDATVDACLDGATGADVRRAWTSSGEPVPPVPLLHGSGLGAEPPVVTGETFGDDAVLRAGSVVSVTGWVAAEGTGGFLERETVLVTDGAPRRLSRFGHGPAGEG